VIDLRCWIAAVIRDDDDNVLICRDADSGEWDLPAGQLRAGEEIPAGVRRVVTEKVTIGVSVGWLAGMHSHVHDGLTLVFFGKHVLGRVQPQGATHRCRWVAPELALQMLGSKRGDQLRGALEEISPQPVLVTQIRRRL